MNAPLFAELAHQALAKAGQVDLLASILGLDNGDPAVFTTVWAQGWKGVDSFGPNVCTGRPPSAIPSAASSASSTGSRSNSIPPDRVPDLVPARRKPPVASGSDRGREGPNPSCSGLHSLHFKPARSCDPRLAWFDSGAAP